jgi:hypothetical protein
VERLVLSQDGKILEVLLWSLRFRASEPKRFAGFLERFIGDWLPPFEQALGAAGFSPERARSLATLSLAAMRGLQLALLATGERARKTRHSGKC